MNKEQLAAELRKVLSKGMKLSRLYECPLIEDTSSLYTDAEIVLEALREYLFDRGLPVYRDDVMQLKVSLPKRNSIVLRYWPPDEIWYGYVYEDKPGRIKKITPRSNFIGTEKIADPDSFARIADNLEKALAMARDRTKPL